MTETIVIDLGTTGIAYISQHGQKTVVRSPIGIVQKMKEPTTLHIVSDKVDIFGPDILERSYFGEQPTRSAVRYMQSHSQYVDYNFHGLKTVVYSLQERISPINDPSLHVSAVELFKVVLMLLRQAITAQVKQQFNLALLVPANTTDVLKNHLQQLIGSIFTDLTSIQFVQEPVAATKFAFTQLQNNQSLSSIAVLDLGGGTCDFSLLQLKNNEFIFRKTGAVFAGGYFVDQKFMNFVNSFEKNQRLKTGFLNQFQIAKTNYNGQFKPFVVKNWSGGNFENIAPEFQQFWKKEEFEMKILLKKEIEFSAEFVKFCYEETVQKMKTGIKEFFENIDEEIDQIIVVGGLAESKFVFKEAVSQIPTQIQGKCIQIAQGSLSIIKGGSLGLQCQNVE
ncbi:Cytosolic_heat shock protein 70 [Hexamita inflata]|uniref:Cytosolic heat shock protein 70 n=1 Tax=Hexamita inflata TaxID=28002 RepID=A0AA86V3A9_9EUKA|nr:Cytosolic heat shock protein 70 [Hexamita inflata]